MVFMEFVYESLLMAFANDIILVQIDQFTDRVRVSAWGRAKAA